MSTFSGAIRCTSQCHRGCHRVPALVPVKSASSVEDAIDVPCECHESARQGQGLIKTLTGSLRQHWHQRGAESFGMSGAENKDHGGRS